MSKNEPKKKLVGPWQSVHVVIWVMGIYILASRGWWWPGILVLVALSALFEAFVRRFVPEAYVAENPTGPASPEQAITPTAPIAPSPSTMAASIPEHRIDLLPQVCPSCNGPIRGNEVKWTGPQSANCPYCGTNLPMNKA